MKDKSKRFKVFTYVNGRGELEGTFPRNNLEKSLHGSLSWDSTNESDINKYFTTNGVLNEHDIITPQMKKFEVGDDVIVLESMLEIIGLMVGFNNKKTYEELEDMVGGIYPIQSVDLSEDEYFDVYGTTYTVNGHTIPQHVLAPAYKPEPKLSDAEAREGTLFPRLHRYQGVRKRNTLRR